MAEHIAHNGLVVGSIPTKPKMKFNYKNFKIKKTKNYMKKNKLFIFVSSIGNSLKNPIFMEQKLKNINFSYYKIYNKTVRKALKSSIYYRAIKFVLNSTIFLIKPKIKKLLKQILYINFKFYNFLILKLNNKIYKTIQLKKNYSLNYKINKLFIFKFAVINLKKIKTMRFERMTFCSQSRHATHCVIFCKKKK